MKKRAKKVITPNNLQPLRSERGLTVRAFAAKTKKTATAISLTETMQQGMDTNDLLVYARVLGVHPSKIIDMSEFEQPVACDTTVLSLVIGWLHEAIELGRLDVTPKKLGEWASFAYNHIIEHDLAFKDMRKFVYDLVKLHHVATSKR